jgi:hypothetical protein
MLRLVGSKERLPLKHFYFSRIGFKKGRPTFVDYFYTMYKRPYRWLKSFDKLLGFAPITYFNFKLRNPFIFDLVRSNLKIPKKITQTYYKKFLQTKLSITYSSTKYLNITAYRFLSTLDNKYIYRQTRLKPFLYFFNTQNKVSSYIYKKIKKIKSTNLILKKKIDFKFKIFSYLKPYHFKLAMIFTSPLNFLFTMFPYCKASIKRRIITRRAFKFPIGYLLTRRIPNFMLIDYSLFSFCITKKNMKISSSIQLRYFLPNISYYPIWFKSSFIY